MKEKKTYPCLSNHERFAKTNNTTMDLPESQSSGDESFMDNSKRPKKRVLIEELEKLESSDNESIVVTPRHSKKRLATPEIEEDELHFLHNRADLDVSDDESIIVTHRHPKKRLVIEEIVESSDDENTLRPVNTRKQRQRTRTRKHKSVCRPAKPSKSKRGPKEQPFRLWLASGCLTILSI